MENSIDWSIDDIDIDDIDDIDNILVFVAQL